MNTGTRWLSVAAVVGLAAVVVACGSDNSKTSTATTARAATSSPVENVTWELAPGQASIPDVAQARPTLHLAGGTAIGSTGCNAFRGPYTLGPSRLTFGVLSETHETCSPQEMAVESAFVPRLGMSATYTVDANGLHLQDAGGTTLLQFTAAKTSLQGAWTVTGYRAASGDSFATVVSGSTLTATFGADGTLSGETGCNTYNGPWKQGTDNALTIGPLATTRKACTSDDLSKQEQAFLAALQASVQSAVVTNSAVFFNAEGLRTVTLSR